MNRNTTAHKLLDLLSDGSYHSGQALGDTLKISRTAIWKGISQLRELGIEIKSITGKGYCISQSIELLDKRFIMDQLDSIAKQALDQLELFAEIDSTNDYLLSQARSNKERTIACFAEQQHKGKGRRGRQWASPFGTNIYHSLLWPFNKDPNEIMGLSLVAAIAITNTLTQYGVTQGIGLKWPNDVLWQNRKLAGVLIEMVAEPHGNCQVVVGIGINTNLSALQASQIDQPWVSLQDITQTRIQRNQLAGLLLNNLIHVMLGFDREGLKPYLHQWREFDCYYDKAVTLHTENKDIAGIMQGISDRGELILQTGNSTSHFLCGDVSLRLQQKHEH